MKSRDTCQLTSMETTHFYRIVDKYLDGTASPEEQQWLEACYEQFPAEDQLPLSPEQKEAIRQSMYARIRPAKLISFRSGWKRAMAAAAVLALILSSYFLFFAPPAKKPDKLSQTQQERYRNDLVPASQGALLTLDDGTRILLDSAANGQLNTQGTTAIKQEGTLAYLPGGELHHQTISTFKGKDFHLTLSDGTQVWLDALSSIYFPTAFPGTERVVEISGQAYFEVAHNYTKPFKVKTGDQVVEVLGTHFNINTYGPVRTTLLEGLVRLHKGNQTVLLHPGQQADAGLSVEKSPDLEEVMAWKNGRFSFNGSTVEEIMEQLARWYDMEVVYQGKVTETFVAHIGRDVPLSSLLSLLELTRQVSFSIDGKKITVTGIKTGK